VLFSRESRGLEVRQAVSAHLNSYELQGAHLVARPHLEHGLRESLEFHPMPPVSLSSTSIIEEKRSLRPNDLNFGKLRSPINRRGLRRLLGALRR
jgi:hypothetical protein